MHHIIKGQWFEYFIFAFSSEQAVEQIIQSAGYLRN